MYFDNVMQVLDSLWERVTWLASLDHSSCIASALCEIPSQVRSFIYSMVELVLRMVWNLIKLLTNVSDYGVATYSAWKSRGAYLILGSLDWPDMAPCRAWYITCSFGQ